MAPSDIPKRHQTFKMAKRRAEEDAQIEETATMSPRSKRSSPSDLEHLSTGVYSTQHVPVQHFVIRDIGHDFVIKDAEGNIPAWMLSTGSSDSSGTTSGSVVAGASGSELARVKQQLLEHDAQLQAKD